MRRIRIVCPQSGGLRTRERSKLKVETTGKGVSVRKEPMVFSAIDRTIAEYAARIREGKPCSVA
jgi:hypothetical protein